MIGLRVISSADPTCLLLLLLTFCHFVILHGASQCDGPFVRAQGRA